MLIEIIARAAANNHGLTLQPAQVQELLGALAGQQTQLTTHQHRLNTATRIISVLIGDEQHELPVSVLDQAVEGFWVYHDKDAEVIKIGPGQEIPEDVMPPEFEAEVIDDPDPMDEAFQVGE